VTPTEASASAGRMWLEEPVTGVHQEPLASAPADANLVTAICKDLSMPSAMLSLASATVSMGCMLDSVTDVYRGTGAFRAASPASAMAMLRTATH
jgi:hypothetical protein